MVDWVERKKERERVKESERERQTNRQRETDRMMNVCCKNKPDTMP